MKLHDTGQGTRLDLVAGEEMDLLLTAGAPYDAPNAGTARRAVIFDSMRRELRRQGIPGRLRLLFLEMDERVLTRARVEGMTPDVLTGNVLASWRPAMEALRVDPPDELIRHRDLQERAGTLLDQLLKCGAARQDENGIRFLTKHDPAYGSLSRQNPEQLLTGSGEADHAAGFYLWRPAGEGEPGSWNTPLGHGFYTQPLLSAAALDGTGLRAGPQSELFPLHENEAAIFRVLHRRPGASAWLHHGLLTVDAGQVSRLAGHAWYLSELLAEFPAEVLRYYFLSHHYRSPILYSPVEITACIRACRRLAGFIGELGELPGRLPSGIEMTREQLDGALADDFNTPRAIGLAHKLRSGLRKHPDWPAVPGTGELKCHLREVFGEVLRIV